MRNFLTVLAAGSAVALVSFAAPTTAEAHCRGCGIAAGVIGGIAAGAAIASATRSSYSGYYRSRWYGGATSDFYHSDRDLVGTR